MTEKQESRKINRDVGAADSLTLDLYVAPDSFDVLIYDRNAADSLSFHSFPLENEGGSGIPVKNIEEIVYENPVLLSPFGNISTLIQSREYIIVPENFASDESFSGDMLRQTFPEMDESDGIFINRIPEFKAAVVFGVNETTTGFLNRNFTNPGFFNHLTPLLHYFGTRGERESASRIIVNMRGKSLDIIACRRNRLILCKTINYSTIDDAVYFILSIRHSVEMTDDTNEILVSGEREKRLAVIGALRDFVPSVMPVIFPPAVYRRGHDSINAPFELSLLSLCE